MRLSSPARIATRQAPHKPHSSRFGFTCETAPQSWHSTRTAGVSIASIAPAQTVPAAIIGNAAFSKCGSTPASGPTRRLMRFTNPPCARAIPAACCKIVWQMASSCIHPASAGRILLCRYHVKQLPACFVIPAKAAAAAAAAAAAGLFLSRKTQPKLLAKGLHRDGIYSPANRPPGCGNGEGQQQCHNRAGAGDQPKYGGKTGRRTKAA